MAVYMGSGSSSPRQTHTVTPTAESSVAGVRAAVAEQNPESWGAAYGVGVTVADPTDGDMDTLLAEALTDWATDDWGEPAAAVSLIPPPPLEPEPEPEPAAAGNVAFGEDPPAWYVPDPDPDWPHPTI